MSKSRKYLVRCAQCGRAGYPPHFLNPDFGCDPQRRTIRNQLIKTQQPLALNEAGICDRCDIPKK